MLGPAAIARAFGALLAAQRMGFGYDGRVQQSPVPPVEPGARGELSVTILDEVPPGQSLLVRLESSAVTVLDNRLGFRDVVDAQAQQLRVRARFVAPEHPGLYEVEGMVEYVSCDEQRCRPHRARVVWTIEVVASEAAE
ncbi:MAG: hypothetical protein AAF799_01350 [Myxococcota bacterium]